MLDHAAVERAEAEIDRFVNSRSKQREDANALAAIWAASERRELAKRREENRAAWADYYRRLAGANLLAARDYRRRARLLEAGE